MDLHYLTKRETCNTHNNDHYSPRTILTGGAAGGVTAATKTTTSTPRKSEIRNLNSSSSNGLNSDREKVTTNQDFNAVRLLSRSNNGATIPVGSSCSSSCHGEFCSLVQVLDANRDLVVIIKKNLQHLEGHKKKRQSLVQPCKYENGAISKQHDIDGRTRAYKVLKKVLKKEELMALEDSGDITRFSIRDKIVVVKRGGEERGGDDNPEQIRNIPRQCIDRSKLEFRWKFLALQDMDDEVEERSRNRCYHENFHEVGRGGILSIDSTMSTIAPVGSKSQEEKKIFGKTHHHDNINEASLLVPVCDMCFHVYRLLTQVRCVQDESFRNKVLGTNEDIAFKLTSFVEKMYGIPPGRGSSTTGSRRQQHPYHHDLQHYQQQQQQHQQHQQHQEEPEKDSDGEKEGSQYLLVDLLLSETNDSDFDCKEATKDSVGHHHSEETTKPSPSKISTGNSLNNDLNSNRLDNVLERRKDRQENQRTKMKMKPNKMSMSPPSKLSSSIFSDGSNKCSTSSNYRYEIKKFAIDDLTDIVYCVMEGVADKRSPKQSTAASRMQHLAHERCNLIVCHDLFETLERMQIFLSHFMENYGAHKILLWNYAGQAYTKFSDKQCLNNEYHARCLEKLADHLGVDGTKEFVTTSTSPYFVMGHGQGASIACLYAKARQHPNLKGLFLINPLSFIDTHYASIIHDCRNVFQCAPEERPDLPIYFYSRFLFSDKYLEKTSTALALNLYTAIYNPITLNGRIRLCDGVLNNVDLREKVKSLLPPIVSVHGDKSSLIRPLHAATFVESRESCSTLHQALYRKSGRRTIVITMEGGHELLQERKKNIYSLLEQLLTGEMNDHEGENQHVVQSSISDTAKQLWSSSPPAFSHLVETVSDLVRKDNNQIHSSKTIKGNNFDDGPIGGARKPKRDGDSDREKGPSSKGKREVLLLNPNDPAFERHKNSIYKPNPGSILYSMHVDGKTNQEYMSWRIRRNKKRLSRFQRAAKVIQDASRVYMAKTMLARLKRQTSALTIQRVYRGMVGRTMFKNRRKELWAASFVQRVYRGSLGRKTSYFTRISKQSQVNIARIWRGYLSRKRVRQILLQRISAATQFQSLWRRCLAIRRVGTLKIHHHSATVIQRYYRGHKGRKDANIEREKYLFSRSQMRGIELGRNILAEHKSHATRLQSELNILTKDKKLLEEKVRQITKEIEKFQEQTESLESSMQQVCMAEVSLKSSIYSSARAAADVMIREKKSQLDDEFSSLLLKISDRKNQLQLLEEKLAHIAKEKQQKEHDLRMLERKLVVLLEAQETELAAIRSRQKKKEISILRQNDDASTTTTIIEQNRAGSACNQASTFDSSKASKLMESTEAMMKFGFTSMTMTYFTALNMVKAMKSMSTQDIPFLSEQSSVPLSGIQHSENQSLKSMYTKQMKSPVSYWGVDHVVEWLKALSLGQYEDSFRDGSIDGPFLCELTDDDLLNVLGVEHKLHRKKILLGIAQLRSLSSTDATATNNNSLQPPITTTAPSSPALKSRRGAILKQNTVDPTTSSSVTNVQRTALELQNTDTARTIVGETGNNNILVVQPSLEDLSRWVRNQKYAPLNEALAPFPCAKFDPRDIRVAFMEGLGTVYVKSISDEPFHLNRSDEHGNTLMHIAAQNGNLRIAKLLIEKGANPNHQNKQGQTPGHFAVAYQFYDFASWLFDKNGGNGDDMILNMYGLGPYDGLVDDDDDDDEEEEVITEDEE